MTFPRVFILSPAHCGGERARLLFNDRAKFDLARRVRSRDGATLGEVFTFLSGLYFRGKLAYAHAFARPPAAADAVRGLRRGKQAPDDDGPAGASGGHAGALRAGGALVITTNRGLLCASTSTTIRDLRSMGRGDIHPHNRAYRTPLVRDLRALSEALGEDGRAILLGSIASSKYVEVLLEALGERLLFPQEFVGRGDMSRGGLMLRCVDQRRELTYVPVAGAVRRGSRPAKLAPRLRHAENGVAVNVAGAMTLQTTAAPCVVVRGKTSIRPSPRSSPGGRGGTSKPARPPSAKGGGR